MARTKTGADDGVGLPSETKAKEKLRKEIPKTPKPPDVLKVPSETEKPKTSKPPEVKMEQILRVTSGCCTMKDLESLVTNFLSELEPALSATNKTKEAAETEKLSVKQRLIFFTSTYREIPGPKRNLEYLSKITELLAHYISLEVLTSADPFEADSREGKDLISRIVSTLYTSLDSSEDHVLDTMMKLKAPLGETNSKKQKQEQHLSPSPKKHIPVYSELFKIVVRKAQKRQVNDLTYIRYVLVFCLWKRMIKEDTKLKEKIIKEAARRLRPPPKFVKRRSVLPKVLPKPPKDTKNLTEFFLREEFSVRDKIKKFLNEAVEATHQSNMFINLSCDPRLLNPKVRDPLPLVDSPVQEFCTFTSTADDVWQRLHEEPHSESSIFEQQEDCPAKRISYRELVPHIILPHSVFFVLPSLADVLHFSHFALQWLFEIF